MADKYMESSNHQDKNDGKVRNLEILYKCPTNPGRDKSSGVSSDDETTSSSLIPIPNTLKQMREELRRKINDIGETSEVESSLTSNVFNESTDKIRNSLEELRKKYTLKNETSVAMKVNSANLMLDDILNDSNLNATSKEIQTKVLKESEFKTNTFHESQTSNTEESTPSPRYCAHVPLASIVAHNISPVQCNFVQSFCPKHKSGFQRLCRCSSRVEKDAKSKNNENRKRSLLQWIQDLQVKYKIRAVYRMMQNANMFTRSQREPQNYTARQGILGINPPVNEDVEDEPPICKCGGKRNRGNSYPKKMIFDLVESNDASQSDEKSTDREKNKCTCPPEMKCTCFVEGECNCPEVVPQCICANCTCKESKAYVNSSEKSFERNSVQTSRTSLIKKVDEFAQTETKTLSQKNQTQEVYPTEANAEGNERKTKNVTKNFPEWKRYCSRERKSIERTDIYYFDHGNSAYYRTTDNHPLRYTECLVERTDEYATKFWAEIFGAIGVGIAFLISFILQLYRFLFTSLVRALTVGFLQIFSDYFFKPLLTILFNGILQPCLILAYNIATSFRDLCLPISQIFGFFAKEIATIFRSCRLIEINRGNCKQSCYCENKV